ncbi:GtrA family protein [Frondihabitans australicus]|uniref:Putative flippase GtrA n=1 Tax=Frondihabitans australicus TaxID=386892 RepID=A0A495IGQ3_9MICO|nr:GtrA family protein [Frondihabitans australicus]RKR75144.1 putative flippase GtrA [Frondihabitans australicus]
MIRLARRLLADERFRFLLVGGFNTVFGYALFAAFELTIGHTIGYLGSLYASYAISTVVAFVLHRRFTFRAQDSGNVVVDFLRFCGVYVVSLAINSVILPLLVEVAHWQPLVAQAVTVVVTTLISYFGHKFFSFRRRPAPVPGADPGVR